MALVACGGGGANSANSGVGAPSKNEGDKTGGSTGSSPSGVRASCKRLGGAAALPFADALEAHYQGRLTKAIQLAKARLETAPFDYAAQALVTIAEHERELVVKDNELRMSSETPMDLALPTLMKLAIPQATQPGLEIKLLPRKPDSLVADQSMLRPEDLSEKLPRVLRGAMLSSSMRTHVDMAFYRGSRGKTLLAFEQPGSDEPMVFSLKDSTTEGSTFPTFADVDFETKQVFVELTINQGAVSQYLVAAYTMDTGKLAWSYQPPGTSAGQFAAHQGLVLVPVNALGKDTLHVLDAKTGVLLKQMALPGSAFRSFVGRTGSQLVLEGNGLQYDVVVPGKTATTSNKTNANQALRMTADEACWFEQALSAVASTDKGRMQQAIDGLAAVTRNRAMMDAVRQEMTELSHEEDPTNVRLPTALAMPFPMPEPAPPAAPGGPARAMPNPPWRIESLQNTSFETGPIAPTEEDPIMVGFRPQNVARLAKFPAKLGNEALQSHTPSPSIDFLIYGRRFLVALEKGEAKASISTRKVLRILDGGAQANVTNSAANAGRNAPASFSSLAYDAPTNTIAICGSFGGLVARFPDMRPLWKTESCSSVVIASGFVFTNDSTTLEVRELATGKLVHKSTGTYIYAMRVRDGKTVVYRSK
jgi:hypothetical protein